MSNKGDDKLAMQRRIDRISEFYQWAERLRKQQPLSDVIDIVSARWRRAKPDDEYTLTSILSDLLVSAGRASEAERIINEMIARLPDNVRLPINKASLHLYYTGEPEKALEAIGVALERAHRVGMFRREALGVKARILLKLGRGEQLTRTLEEIMALEIKPGTDIGRERDFVDRAPPEMIPQDVLARYNTFRPWRDSDATDLGPDESPAWEPGDDDK